MTKNVLGNPSFNKKNTCRLDFIVEGRECFEIRGWTKSREEP